MASSPAGMAQTMLNTVVLVFTLLAGLVVFLRLFTRGLVLHKAGAEDIWITFAMILSIGLTVTIALQVSNGLGMHIRDLTPAMMTNSLKSFWASVWIYNLALTATKISILTQYLRVFPTPQFRKVCLVVMGFVAIYGLWTLLGSIFLCFPVAYFWDRTIANGRCLNQEAIWFSNASVNIAQDVIVLFLPMAVLKSLDIPNRQKRALIVVFGLGGLVCLVSIIRLQTLVSVSNSTDPTFDNPPAAMLSAIETNVGIICACLPSMRPLLAAMMPVYFSGSSQYSNLSNWKHDVEQPKQFRGSSASSLPYDTKTLQKPYDSRPESPASNAHGRSRSNSRTYIRPESTGEVSTPAATLRSWSRASTHFRTGSDSSRLNTHDAVVASHSTPGSKREDGLRTPVSAHRISSQSLRRHDEGQAPMNPLRMSPFSPVIPRLPRLPENMAVMGTIESRNGGSGPGVQSRPTRTPLFHKPLPITPLPGHQHAPQYLTMAQDQAILPVQLSPGLIPPPLKLGGSPSQPPS